MTFKENKIEKLNYKKKKKRKKDEMKMENYMALKYIYLSNNESNVM